MPDGLLIVDRTNFPGNGRLGVGIITALSTSEHLFDLDQGVPVVALEDHNLTLMDMLAEAGKLVQPRVMSSKLRQTRPTPVRPAYEALSTATAIVCRFSTNPS